jgi:hypothetical protein
MRSPPGNTAWDDSAVDKKTNQKEKLVFYFREYQPDYYASGRFWTMAWSIAMMMFKNTTQSNNHSPPFRGYNAQYYIILFMHCYLH